MLPNRRPRFDDSQLTRVPTGEDLAAPEAPLTRQVVMPSTEIDVSECDRPRVPRGDETVVPRGDDTMVPHGDATLRTPMPRAFDRSEASGELSWENEEVTRIDPASDPELSCSDIIEITDTDSGKGGKEPSVVRRFLDSVATVVPRVFGRAPKQSPAAPKPAAVISSVAAPTIDQRAWREMRTAAIFDGLPNEALRDALLCGDARVVVLERDSLVPLDGALGLVRLGQVALGVFAPDALKAERDAQARAASAGKIDKKERNRRKKLGPLVRLAERNLATFEDGDVVETSIVAAEHGTLACYAVTPVSVVTIARSRADLWRRIYPFMADRLRRAASHARARVEATDGAKSLVADFFIRHGLSVAMTLRVRKLDACIDCGACEQACEDRYGAKRLSLNGRILGGLDFVDACHTCTDQRCIDPCNFDAIRFDTERREILIEEANCTGCTLCATACPYDAIEMYDLDDKPGLKLRLGKAGALAFGDGTPRKAKLRQIAQKCDHCAFYAEQACVTACPTGALIEVLPEDVVSTLPDQARASARAGYDRTTTIDVNKLNETSAFVKGLAGKLTDELGRARAPRVKVLIGLWWSVGLVAVVLAAIEIALRKLAPAWSLSYFIATRVDGLEPEIALGKVDYRPGCQLAVNLGYAGTAVMLSGMAYVWRRRFPFMRNWGSLRAWFDWHVMTGVVGPLFILMHSAAKLDNWVSIAFWSMVLTVVSGLLGRYLTTELPELASTATVETLEVDRQLGILREAHPGVRSADGWFESYRRHVAQWERRRGGGRKGGKHDKRTFLGAVATFFWVLGDDLARSRRGRRLKWLLKKSVRDASARRKAVKLAERLALLERRRVMLPLLEPLFNQWKAVHVPMAILLTIVATLHIVLALRSS